MGDNQANVTVDQSWLNSLFLHFIGRFPRIISPQVIFLVLTDGILFWHLAILYAIFIGIFHFVRYYHNKILSSKKTNYLTLSLCGWMTIIIITDYAVLQSIKNAMQSLSPGGLEPVITNPESGSSIPIHSSRMESHLSLLILHLAFAFLFDRFLADCDRLPVNPCLSFSYLVLSASRSEPRNKNPTDRSKNPRNKKLRKNKKHPPSRFKFRDKDLGLAVHNTRHVLTICTFIVLW